MRSTSRGIASQAGDVDATGRCCTELVATDRPDPLLAAKVTEMLGCLLRDIAATAKQGDSARNLLNFPFSTTAQCPGTKLFCSIGAKGHPGRKLRMHLEVQDGCALPACCTDLESGCSSPNESVKNLGKLACPSRTDRPA